MSHGGTVVCQPRRTELNGGDGVTDKKAISGMDTIASGTTITDAVMSWGRSGQTEISPGGFGDPATMPAAAAHSTGLDSEKK
jgi:hypothetical protein